MRRAKNQHYVPQFYLRGFTQDGQRLFVYDKFRRESFRSSVGNVASERFFYDFPPDIVAEGADPQLIEKELSRMEKTFGDVLSEVVRMIEEGHKIESRQRTVMSVFIAMQVLRTREQRVLGTQVARATLEALRSDGIMTDTPDISLIHAVVLFHPLIRQVLVPVLFNHIWLVGRNDTSKPLYTSDSPVVRKAHKHDRFVSYGGLGSEGIEVAFPLTPKHVLVLCDRASFTRAEQLDGSTMQLDTEHVAYYNRQQVAQSYRQVYCSADDFNLAERICDEHPDVCAPDRPRIITDGWPLPFSDS
jgi:hypothetical protein